jgi:hypothetical protein
MSIAPGNKFHVFPEVPPNSTEGRENAIVANTERQMFHQSPAIDNPARTMGGGVRNSIAEMQDYDGKRLSESYRIGLSRSAEAHDGVADR